jgi:hypothetical protein
MGEDASASRIALDLSDVSQAPFIANLCSSHLITKQQNFTLGPE